MDEMVKTEVLDATPINVLDTQERASIDMQVSTAKRYPRSISRFKENAIAIATIDDDTAASCLYRRPVGKDSRGKETYAEGMSVRMAEIVGASYGNLRVGSRIVSQTERQVVAQGVAHDMENNFFSTSEVVEVTVDKGGRPYSERMRAVLAKAALAKARRDATFQVVPKALAKPVENAVKDLLFGNQKSLSVRRESIAKWIKTLGIDSARVFAAIAVEGLEDIGPAECETLTGLKTALKDNDIGMDEAFPPLAERKNPLERHAPATAATQDNPAADIPASNEHAELLDKIGVVLAEAGMAMDDADAWAMKLYGHPLREQAMATLRNCVKNPESWLGLVAAAKKEGAQ